jgi:hypothetical protein
MSSPSGSRRGSTPWSSEPSREEARRESSLELDLHDKLVRRYYLLYIMQASPEERIEMCEPIGWRPPLPRDLQRQIRYLEARVAAGERGNGIPPP